MSIKERLIEIRKLIQKGWCKDAAARTKNGNYISYKDKNAARFCLSGANYRVLGKKTPTERFMVRELEKDGYNTLWDFNDTRSDKRQVLRFLDRCINSFKKEKV